MASCDAAWAHQVRSDHEEEFFIVLPKSPTKGDILVYSRGYAKGKVEFYLGNNAGFVIDAGNLELIDPLWVCGRGTTSPGMPNGLCVAGRTEFPLVD
jgi:hypothetical protein